MTDAPGAPGGAARPVESQKYTQCRAASVIRREDAHNGRGVTRVVVRDTRSPSAACDSGAPAVSRCATESRRGLRWSTPLPLSISLCERQKAGENASPKK